ncbi:MAG: hypothetical protein AAB393_07815, partial [Bacteroidota bacterium]
MNTTLLNHRERLLIRMEIRQFFLHPRSLHFVPLTLAGVMLVLWSHLASPFIAVIVVVFAGLEPQFNNILFRTPLELESLIMFPTERKNVEKAKNVATILLMG